MSDRVTGEQLYNELCEAASKSGQSLHAFVAPLFSNSWKIEQMRIARFPKSETIGRVRALCSGQTPTPPQSSRWRGDRRSLGLTRQQAEAAGIPASARSRYEDHLLSRAVETKERTEWLRALSEEATATRRPGQTIADRLGELRRAMT